MHQQPGDRSCTNEAIGGNHDGPVIAYLSKVGDATKDAGNRWFKIYQNGLVRTDYWGTDVLNANCGKQVITIPADIAAGDYLLRAEVIALHVAGKFTPPPPSPTSPSNIYRADAAGTYRQCWWCPVLRLVLSAPCHWWWKREPGRCCLPRRVLGERPRYPVQPVRLIHHVHCSGSCSTFPLLLLLLLLQIDETTANTTPTGLW